ncbi:hypothetical protein [uncultured Amnibacterium sp.]|uniref:hypothetical protein n=1 Tax=uncultured Amnibacterium sp. TaxID=1631851 RepID=UPI0035CB4EEA
MTTTSSAEQATDPVRPAEVRAQEPPRPGSRAGHRFVGATTVRGLDLSPVHDD